MDKAAHLLLARGTRHWIRDTVFEPIADVYVRNLVDRGYSLETTKAYLRCVAHFAHWSAGKHLRLADFDESHVDCFLEKHLPTCRCGRTSRRAAHEIRAALRNLLELLRESGQCASKQPSFPAAIALELQDFDDYLREVRGLSTKTRFPRRRQVGQFLFDRFAAGPVKLCALTPKDVIRFVTACTAGLAPGSVKAVGISLRSYFTFKASQGERTAALIAALLRVAQWRHAGLPEILTAQEIKRLLDAFDRTSATGKRDYAITRCLLDLGMRRAEVAQLTLDDVDWRSGSLTIHGKGKREDVLPLPAVTGRAIVEYLRGGRPQTGRREIFVRHCPPSNAAAELDIVRNAVRNAAARCGLERRIRGTHILRHSVAGRLVQAGARFKEIADLLRHRSLDTTTIYAKVDLAALAHVALPWPGRQL
jgi:integrase/recombinase XerD